MNKSNLGVLAQCALRYALPRHTYIVSQVCEIIADAKDELPENTIKLMVKDIRAHLSDVERRLITSHECDEKAIRVLLDILDPPAYNNHSEDEGCNE